MTRLEIKTINFNDFTCSFKVYFDGNNNNLLYYPELNPAEDNSQYEKFIKLVQGMNQCQKQFFLEYHNSSEYPKNDYFDFCPGNDIYSFLFENRGDKSSFYKKYNSKEKLILMRWIFSFLCAIQILIKNNIEIIRLMNRFFFIDSNMEARVFYSLWDKKLSTSTTSPLYYIPREDIELSYEKTLETSNINQKTAYSSAVLIISLLNKMPPNEYYLNQPVKDTNKLLKDNQFYLKLIPECSLKPLIEKCLNMDPKNRPSVIDIIKDLIKKEFCLDGVNYDDYLKWIQSKFNTQETDVDKLFKIIEEELNKEIPSEASNECINKGVKISDFPDFIRLASDTSFKENVVRNCESLLEDMKNYLDNLKIQYDSRKTQENKYKLMEHYLNYSRSENFSQGITNLFVIDKMNNNSSFLIKIINGSIRFIPPKSLEFCSNYFASFNDNPLFVHVDEKPVQINFYPFLNVFNLLFGEMKNFNIEYERKIKWIKDISKALKVLFDEYVIDSFNSQDVLIDINLDAHLLPSKMKKKETNTENFFYFNNETNYDLWYCAPETIEECPQKSTSEEKIIFAFGVFIHELISNEKPGKLLSNLTAKGKRKLLLKKRMYEINNDKKLTQIINTCINYDPKSRKTFNEISEMIEQIDIKVKKIIKEEITKNIDEKDKMNPNLNFDIKYLQLAADRGSIIPDKIFDYLYSKLSVDEKISYSYSNDTFSKYELVLFFYNHHNDDILINVNSSRKSIKTKIDTNCNKEENDFYCEVYYPTFQKESDNLVKQHHNKPIEKFWHYAGLGKKSARQFTLRSGKNLDPFANDEIKIIVKNKYDFPYGGNVKMKFVGNVIEGYLGLGLFPKKMEIVRKDIRQNKKVEYDDSGIMILKNA